MAQLPNKDDSSLRSWRTWCVDLWREAEKGWISRTGQDHFNRDKVILPALQAKLASELNYCSLVDLGCGDGYCTSVLLQFLDACGKCPGEVWLLDMSSHQLAAALAQPRLAQARAEICDLQSESWFTNLSSVGHPVVIVSILALQELPSLEPLVAGLAKVLKPGDLGLLVTLASEFSQRLADLGQIRLAHENANPNLDWQWAGVFPVPVGDTTVGLPHFQRDLQKIVAAFTAHGLVVDGTIDLCVPDSASARQAFAGTPYENDIIGRPSSVLLSIKATIHGGKK